MDYAFKEIEQTWQKYWKEQKTFSAKDLDNKPKFYALDMFPYPSGAGLHVGHPLGYIASDIYARYKRHKGFNVLHPMGYDSFGLPAEQYAIQTGQHPKITTQENISTYRRQLDQIGFSFDWDREIRTSTPEYYKWTQWIFTQIFHSWYNLKSNKAEPISALIQHFQSFGTDSLEAHCDQKTEFTAKEWNDFSEKEKADILMNYRLTYLADSYVNWCPALGTVLANDEIKDGLSERGGHPVEKKLMKQWSMRISAYAQRLLDGIETLDWSEAIKEIQRNWIGKSQGAALVFELEGYEDKIEVFTTRPDTIFGVSFLVLAPEHDLVKKITSKDQSAEITAYVQYANSRSERERLTDVKKITGAFTGAYAIHPLTGDKLPIWIGDYVLAGYGTGAVMAVPSGDQRDWDFANHFGLDIPAVIEGQDVLTGADARKDGILCNSAFLNGLSVPLAIKKAIETFEEKKIGKGQINFRLRDAVFSRQRYWGEPIPVYYENGIAKCLELKDLPLNLPEVDKYLPTEDGEPPLARAIGWTYNGYPLETSTMPGWAGSSWYLFRYMDSQEGNSFASKEKLNYWKNVDLYIGGSEHGTGHLLYSRFWTKFLFDLGFIEVEEPFKKLINQGMILGNSRFVYRKKGSSVFVSKNKIDQFETTAIHVDVNLVNGDELDLERFKLSRAEYQNAEFILEEGKYICGSEVEKMSKSKFNVVNPDDIILRYGADTLRLYEMFLGPLEQAKPWDMEGIEGVHRFLRKFWRLYHDQNNVFVVSDEEASKESLKSLHKTIKKVNDDIERFSFNTSVSAFMICVNELSEQKCNSRSVLSDLCVLISPFAPHIAEEIWNKLGNSNSISVVNYPSFEEKYLIESTHKYPVSFNGKMRFILELPLNMDVKMIEETVLAHEEAQKWLEGKTPKKTIIIPGKIVNMVL